MKYTVRLLRIEINNVKNVKHGEIEIPHGKKGSILGIYGANGSGKTVVVDCMVLLKCLLSGHQIPSNFYYYINELSDTANIKYRFEIKLQEKRYLAEYEVELQKNGKKSFCISREKMSQREMTEGKRLTPVFDYEYGRKELFRPLKLYAYFAKNMQDMIALGVAQQATQNLNEEKRIPEVASFLFSKRAQDVFEKARGDAQEIFLLSHYLQKYGIYDLAVVENAQYGYLSLNLENMPVNIDWPDTLPKRGEGVFLRFTDTNVVPKEVFPYIVNTVKQINIVMKSLIPEISIGIYNPFDKLMQDGNDGVQFELIAMRGENRIPLLYESAGIKKLISICTNLGACYNRESYCLVVDELDSGIYEYLLGECLEIMQDKARGQLIFTSHNLRPLEILENDSLLYTTVNPEKRYVKSAYIKNTQNTRLSYLRTIKLGGQKEKLYNETNIYEMELAMRRAGRVRADD